jgi:acyl carrier protein
MNNIDKIISFIQNQLIDNQTQIQINPTTSLFNQNILDSLSLLSLISFIESTFNIKISPSEVTPNNFDTVDKINSFIEKN